MFKKPFRYSIRFLSAAYKCSSRKLSDVAISPGLELRINEEESTTKPILNSGVKVAVLCAYNGEGYFGIQRAENRDTIQDELLLAMLKSNIISEEGFNWPQSIEYSSTSRTDKGVSAAQQLVSLRVMPMENLFPSLIDEMNQHLPKQVKVFDILKVPDEFISHVTCNGRTYSYSLPTFAFTPFECTVQRNFRITTEILTKINKLLHKFNGSHYFHNFTMGRKSFHSTSRRFIKEIYCSEPFERKGMEWVTITIKGRSFMIHQIRKMIGTVIAIMRCAASEDLIKMALTERNIDVPKAPSNGLVLENIHFPIYNENIMRTTSADIYNFKPINWGKFEKEMNEFKENNIYSNIYEKEFQEGIMWNYMSEILDYIYDSRKYLTLGIGEMPEHISRIRSDIGRARVYLEIHHVLKYHNFNENLNSINRWH